MGSIDNYLFMGEHDLVKLQQAHDLMVKFRDNLFSGPDAHDNQDLLFNRGSLIDDEKRPSSYFDVTDSVYPRSQIKVGLFSPHRDTRF